MQSGNTGAAVHLSPLHIKVTDVMIMGSKSNAPCSARKRTLVLIREVCQTLKELTAQR